MQRPQVTLTSGSPHADADPCRFPDPAADSGRAARRRTPARRSGRAFSRVPAADFGRASRPRLRSRRVSWDLLVSARALAATIEGGFRGGAFSPSAEEHFGATAKLVSKCFCLRFGGPIGGAGARCTRAPVRPRWAKTLFGARPAPGAGAPFGAHISAHRNRAFLKLIPRSGPKMQRPQITPSSGSPQRTRILDTPRLGC